MVISRAHVDTGPLVERVYAKYAGGGRIGKNTCMINQQIGFWLFLGKILTSLESHLLISPHPIVVEPTHGVSMLAPPTLSLRPTSWTPPSALPSDD